MSDDGRLVINGRMAGWEDVRIDVVTDDGERIELPEVKSIAFKAGPGAEALTATIEVFPKALEPEAWAELSCPDDDATQPESASSPQTAPEASG